MGYHQLDSEGALAIYGFRFMVTVTVPAVPLVVVVVVVVVGGHGLCLAGRGSSTCWVPLVPLVPVHAKMIFQSMSMSAVFGEAADDTHCDVGIGRVVARMERHVTSRHRSPR